MQPAIIGSIDYNNGTRKVSFYDRKSREFVDLHGHYEWGTRNNLAVNLARRILQIAASKQHRSRINNDVVVRFVEEAVSKFDPGRFSITEGQVRYWLSRLDKQGQLPPT